MTTTVTASPHQRSATIKVQKRVAAASIVGIAFALFLRVNLELAPKPTHAILYPPGTEFTAPFRIALLSDPHVGDQESSYTAFNDLLAQIASQDVDLIFLTGDFSQPERKIENFKSHRERISKIFGTLGHYRTFAVLGNYEYSSGGSEWRKSLEGVGISVLENEVRRIQSRLGPVCIRGFGDYYSGMYEPTSFPESCGASPKITITHDPAAAFQVGVKGLVFAGHTHCGQVSLPIIGPLWAPTEAPREAWCGLYQDEFRTLWVSSGVGTSILPIRFGAPSQWDLIEVIYEPTSGE